MSYTNTLTPKLIELLNATPDGAKLLMDIIGQGHETFFGTRLNQTKLQKYVAGMVGMNNVHAYLRLGSDTSMSGNAMDTAEAALTDLLRNDNDHSAFPHFDFFKPIFRFDATDGSENSIQLGVWTTVYLNEDEARLEFTQSFKGVSSYTDDLIELYFFQTPEAREMLVSANDATAMYAYKKECIIEAMLSELQAGNAPMQQIADDIERLQKGKIYGTGYVLSRLVRIIQTAELQRIERALSAKASMDYMDAVDASALFAGVIDFSDIK